jgi:protein-arginine kinase activator protein McsA
MTLEEAINHCEEKTKELREQPLKEKMNIEDIAVCEECAEEHEQLAEWLKELKKYREWLKSFNPDSATGCFTAVRELRSMVTQEGSDKE